MSSLRDQIERTTFGRLGQSIATERLIDDISATIQPMLDAKDRKIEHLRERVAELSEWDVGIKNLTAADGSIDMSLSMAHDMMRVYVSAFTEILDKEGGPNYCEMSFKLAGTLDTYTVTIRRPEGKTPAEVASEQRRRAEKAEAKLAEVREYAQHILRSGNGAYSKAGRTILEALDELEEQ